MGNRAPSPATTATTRPYRPIDDEEDAFNMLPFVGDDQCPWKPPTLSGGDEITVSAAGWLLGQTYAVAFLAHSRAFAMSNPHRPRENLVEIFKEILGGAFPSDIVRGFVSGLGDAIAHGAVELTASESLAKPGRVDQ